MSSGGQGGNTIGFGTAAGGAGGATPPPPQQIAMLPHPFLLLLQRWQEEIRPLEARSFESQKIASDFGKVALSSSVLLNGGALVALPTLMQYLNDNGRSLVGNIALWFPIGLFFVFLALLVAYLNFMSVSHGYMALAHMGARRLDCGYMNAPHAADPEWIKQSELHARCNKITVLTQWISVVSALLSFGAFIFGVWGFIVLAQYNYLPPA